MTPDDANDLQKDQFDRFEDAAAEREPDVAIQLCGALDPDSHNDGRTCNLPAGHGPYLEEGDGDAYAHAILMPGGELLCAWNPQSAPQLCDDRSATGGWATSETRCRLESGHEGEHADGRLRWGPNPSTHTTPTPRCPARERIGSTVLACALGKGHDGSCEWPQDEAADAAYAALEEALRARLAANRPMLLPMFEPAVRVRFIALPSRPANTELRGDHPMRGVYDAVMRPGGFALVVDRFNHLAHVEGEREFWEGFGAKIGAAHVLLYPGTLDTDDLLEQ